MVNRLAREYQNTITSATGDNARHSGESRDAANMNALLPVGGWPPGIALRVLRNGATIGFVVVMDTPMRGDARFGDLRVGSIVDCFGLPEDAAAVVGAGFDFLRARGVDIVVANQSHPARSGALARHGFVVLPRA